MPLKSVKRNKPEEERIICSAIWYDDGKQYPHMPVPTGIVVAGHRHHNCIATMSSLSKIYNPTVQFFYQQMQERVQGFLTSTGRFVDRWQAMAIAYNAGQVSTKKAYTLSPDWTAEKDEEFDYKNFPKKEPRDSYRKDETPFNKLFSEDLY